MRKFSILVVARQPRPRVSLAALLATACMLFGAGAAFAQPEPIAFQAAVPPAPETVQLFHLTSPKPPTEFLNEKLQILKLPGLQTEQNKLISRGSMAPEQRQLVRAFVNPVTGDAHLIPNLAELVQPAPQAGPKPQMLEREKLQATARAVLLDERFIPRDLTELRPVDAIPVLGGSTTRQTALASTPTRMEPRTVMTLVPVARYAAGLPVYGRGSQAVVALANDATVVGLLRRWRAATSSETVAARISGDDVRASIERQLKPQVANGSHAVVDTIVLGYYDGAGDYLQPVYVFEATVTPPTAQVSPIRVRGYVPIGRPREPIPDLAGPPAGSAPAQASMPTELKTLTPRAALDPATDAKIRGEIGGGGSAGDITLGEYANRDWRNDSGYVDMSYAFLDGLTSDNIEPINRTQWYEAWPWEVSGPASRYYLNAVNVAYTVPHGDWLENTTLRNNADFWYVQNIGTGGNPGFGSAAGGVLATWIIMSCEVVPSYYDRQNAIGGSGNGYTAFDAWWPVFQGLHNVIGFRTEMFYPDDNLQWNFGHDAALGGDLNASWFMAVAAAENLDGEYTSQHLNGNPPVHWDRASTMIDGRDLGQSIYSVGAQSPSNTLWNFWMGN